MPNRPPQHRPPGWQPAPRQRNVERDRFYGTAAWRRLSAEVIAAAGGICNVCRKPGANMAHHLVERSKGGPDRMDNLIAVHRSCHNRYHPNKGFR
jgi:5-methylcytosine-specific restriction endonuclease McrA